MFCRSCGTMIPEDSNFCPKCGVKVVMPKQDSPRQAVQKTSYAHTHQNVQAVKRVEQSHKVDGRLFREIAMLVGGLVVVWIGYATWIGSTVGRYLSTKTSNYRLEFGRSAPDAMQWVMGIGGFIINVVGAICLYVAVCALAQRFGAWRRQNKVVGTIFAVIVCLVVLVCFSLKTSATGQFGLWDYLIMAAILGGMWKGKNKEGGVNETGNSDASKNAYSSVNASKKKYTIAVSIILLMFGYALLTVLSLEKRMKESEERNLHAFLDRSALRDADSRGLAPVDYTKRGYKAKTADADDTSAKSAVVSNLPFVGALTSAAVDAARKSNDTHITDALENVARKARISEDEIEKAREYSQGDAEKMNEYFAEIARKRFGERAAKKGEAEGRLAAVRQNVSAKGGCGKNRIGGRDIFLDEECGGQEHSEERRRRQDKADIYEMLSDETLRKIANGGDLYESMTDEELRRVASMGSNVLKNAQPTDFSHMTDEELLRSYYADLAAQSGSDGANGYSNSLTERRNSWITTNAQHRGMNNHIKKDSYFMAAVSGVSLKIPLLEGQSKATVNEQGIVRKYWGSGNLGVGYPAVIAHDKDGTPLFVFDLFYDNEMSAFGCPKNLNEIFSAVKEAYCADNEMRAGSIVAKTVLNTTLEQKNYKGCFATITQRRNGAILATSYMFSGGVYVNKRAFLVQAFSTKSDAASKRLFHKMLELWLETLVATNAR